MTQEEKSLLLKELSARLPYDLQVKTGEDDEPYTLLSVHPNKDIALIGIDMGGVYATSKVKIDTIKPYLRPVSSMTEEEMDRLFDILHIDKDGKDEDWIKINDVYGIKFFFPTGKWVEDIADAYDYLNSIHIDCRGLISKGLAISVTKENNPYEN